MLQGYLLMLSGIMRVQVLPMESAVALGMSHSSGWPWVATLETSTSMSGTWRLALPADLRLHGHAWVATGVQLRPLPGGLLGVRCLHALLYPASARSVTWRPIGVPYVAQVHLEVHARGLRWGV